MTAAPYVPGSGLAGKARRLQARVAGRRMADLNLERGVVSFSFDDFPKSAVAHGAAELERVGARGTFYAATCWLGRKTHHGAMFDEGDLGRLSEAGHEIGAHTHSHIDCGRVEVEAALADAERNLDVLGALGYADIPSFAFPYGEASPAAKRALGARFSTLRAVRPQVMSGRADLNYLPAVALEDGEAGLGRVLAAMRRAQAERAWVIVFTHDIQEEPTPWGCTPAMMRRAVDAAREMDLDILTVGAAAERLAA